jgi:hypothetical protein
MAHMAGPKLMSHQEEWKENDESDLVSWLEMFPRVLAIDPGGVTGWAVIWFDPETIVDRTEPVHKASVAWQAGVISGSENGQIDEILGKIKRYGVSKYEETGELAVVVEDFQLRTQIRSREVLSPVRLTAALDYVLYKGVRCKDEQVRFYNRIPQQPVDAMRTIDDSRLRLWDMYLPGADHPRDATRHALLWLRRLRSDFSLLRQYHDLNPVAFEND